MKKRCISKIVEASSDYARVGLRKPALITVEDTKNLKNKINNSKKQTHNEKTV